jgi:hypothetical protein
MAQASWPEWTVVQLQECIINGLAPEETAGLLGKTKEEVCAKARELGLVLPPAYTESPPTAPDISDGLSRSAAVGRKFPG